MRHPAQTSSMIAPAQPTASQYSRAGYKALRMLAVTRTITSGVMNGILIATPFILYAFDIIPFR